MSRPTHRTRNHKEQITFRTYGLDGTTMDGRAENIIAGDIERYETTFGNFHMISIHFPDKIVQNDFSHEPAEAFELEKLTPLLIGHFDKSDIIHSITPATLGGRSAKCVRFETVDGKHANLQTRFASTMSSAHSFAGTLLRTSSKTPTMSRSKAF